MFDVVDGFLEENTDVRVVERVDNLAAAALADDEAQVAKEAKLVRDGRLLHLNGGSKLADRARRLAEASENPHPARSREGLHRLGNLTRRVRVERCRAGCAFDPVPHGQRLA